MRLTHVLMSAAAAVAFILSPITASSALAKSDAMPMMKKSAKKPAAKSLYTRLGGKPAIRAVVEDFVNNVAADERINKFFARSNLPRLRRLLVEQICAGTGGPCKYTGRSMKASHRGMGVRDADFNALVQNLQKTLKKFGVPAKEQGELLAILGPMRRDIVERR